MKGFKERRGFPSRLLLIRAQATAVSRLPDKTKAPRKPSGVKPRGR